MRSGPFLMSSSGNESHGQCASYAFGFVKKYSFIQKLQPKTFCSLFSTTRFSENIFSKKYFWKIKNFDFSKNSFSIKNFSSKLSMIFFSTKNYFFEKSKFLIFRKLFFRKLFFENRVMKKMSQTVFGCNFWKIEYFFTNPKAYEQAWRCLSFPLLDIQNGPLRKMLSPKNLGGSF